MSGHEEFAARTRDLCQAAGIILDRFDPSELRDTRGRWARRPGGTSPAAAGGIREVSPEEFTRAFDAAFAGSLYAAFVNHYTPAQIRAGRMTPLLGYGGKAGVLIHDHGDGRVEATALFNDSGQHGAGVALLRLAIREHGVNYVECFGPALPRMYGTLGFADDQVYKFDPEQSPKGWDRTRFDTPEYHTMRLARTRQAAARAAGDSANLDRIRAEAAAADPVWWKQYGEQAWAAALACFGVTSPHGDADRPDR